MVIHNSFQNSEVFRAADKCKLLGVGGCAKCVICQFFREGMQRTGRGALKRQNPQTLTLIKPLVGEICVFQM